MCKLKKINKLTAIYIVKFVMSLKRKKHLGTKFEFEQLETII